jgi:hypothetical protein
MFKRYILQPNVTRVVATPCCSQIGRFLGNFGKHTQTAASSLRATGLTLGAGEHEITFLKRDAGLNLIG